MNTILFSIHLSLSTNHICVRGCFLFMSVICRASCVYSYFLKFLNTLLHWEGNDTRDDVPRHLEYTSLEWFCEEISNHSLHPVMLHLNVFIFQYIFYKKYLVFICLDFSHKISSHSSKFSLHFHCLDRTNSVMLYPCSLKILFNHSVQGI